VDTRCDESQDLGYRLWGDET